MNLMNGMKRTAKKEEKKDIEDRMFKSPAPKVIKQPAFGTESVCEIIKACSAAGVYNLRFRGLELKLSPKKEVFHPSPKQKEDGLEKLNKEQYKVAQEDLVEQEYLTKKAILEEMRITDPEAYEDLLVKGEIDESEIKEE